MAEIFQFPIVPRSEATGLRRLRAKLMGEGHAYPVPKEIEAIRQAALLDAWITACYAATDQSTAIEILERALRLEKERQRVGRE